MNYVFAFFMTVTCLFTHGLGKAILELQSLNFELTITSYQYLAVLFYDESDKGIALEKAWSDAASLIDTSSICNDCEISKVISYLFVYLFDVLIFCKMYVYMHIYVFSSFNFTPIDIWTGS
jgi:hypothetical protein